MFPIYSFKGHGLISLLLFRGLVGRDFTAFIGELLARNTVVANKDHTVLCSR